MKTDRELLELAAKAAGISVVAWTKFFDEWKFACNPCGEPWNPLIDDGDALRLSVKLKIAVTYPDNENVVRCWYGDIGTDPIYEPLTNDHCAATRRAIVRAAAAIGEAMQ